MEDVALWGIHTGRYSEANKIFKQEKTIALGWHEVGDISKFEPTRDSFKEQISASYPKMKPGAVPIVGGQLYRFIHVMKIGDLVIYPSKQDKRINIGRVVGEYFYDDSSDSHYTNRRKVEWLKEESRTTFSQGAMYEIGSALSLFQVKNYADEFIAVVEGKPIVTLEEADDTVAYIAEDIEQFSSDFVLRTLSRELKGHPFAEFVAHLLNKMGYKTRVSPEGPDRGVDIIAHRDELGFEPPIIKVQVKSVSGNVGDPVVSALYGKVDKNEFGMIVTLGGFTSQAINFAQNKSNLRLIDGEEIVNLIFSYYEELDSRYKGILPLKQVYVPEVLPDQEE